MLRHTSKKSDTLLLCRQASGERDRCAAVGHFVRCVALLLPKSPGKLVKASSWKPLARPVSLCQVAVTAASDHNDADVGVICHEQPSNKNILL